jgi:addiction module RelE/StbE family toxin
LAKIVYSGQALNDLDRLTDFLLAEFPQAALETIELIQEAVNMLKNHPLIGRETDQDLRELVISRGQSGYIALYSYEYAFDTVLILSIRHQREAGLESY